MFLGPITHNTKESGRNKMSSSMLRFRMARWRWALGKVIVVAAVAALAVLPPVLNKTKAASGSGKAAAPAAAPATLSSVPVPLPPNLGDFVTDRAAAIVLGKSLFWDMQAGGDGKQACASCHFQAGVDNRTRNTINPRGETFRGANYQLTSADYPFHRLADPNNNASAVLSDTKEVTGSQGLIKADFLNINEGSPADSSTTVPDATFNIGGVNARQVTGRNTPTIINAVFNNRNFWDGRANRFFNGVNPFGEMDANAKVWSFDGTAMTQVAILLDNASLASQAVGPPNNNVEMSFNGRTFPLLGRKMLSLPPLGTQKVDSTDSVLGSFANLGGNGLKSPTSYASLIRSAFNSKWWGSPGVTPDGFTHMEANFSLYWGLSIMLYESTLVSDQSPFDKFAAGNSSALTAQQKAGMSTFMGAGKCNNCHSGSEFTSASVSSVRGNMIKLMQMGDGTLAFYDTGFYNIGARPTEQDVGVGGGSPFGQPLSLSLRVQQGFNPDLRGQAVTIAPGARVAVNGAFKTPSLRNVELTGPYMHNGGMRTLTEVVEFYARGTDFSNIADRDPDVNGVGKLRGSPDKVAEVVSFLKALTDERVRNQSAPFDHPELTIFNGHTGVTGAGAAAVALDNPVVLPAVGSAGGPPLKSFEATLP